jgi:peptidoglycan/xylan/chitin deacetylase (PgdA/CDA1 family)
LEPDWRTRRRLERRAGRRRRGRLFVLAGVVAAAAGAAVLAVVSGGGGQAPYRVLRPSAVAASRPARRRIGGQRRAARAALLRRERAAAVPILIYHVIAPPLPDARFPGLYVSAEAFGAQMHALARAGYRAVTLDQVRRAWRGGGGLPSKPVVVSFDNGYRSQYTHALPVLRRLRWVGVENLQLSGLPPSQGGLSTAEVRGLIRAGWELDTQGWSHADLSTLDHAELRFQVAHARALLRRRYHVPVDWFCYPSGDYDPTVVAAVKAAGFVGSTTVVPGWARPDDDPYRLPRLRVLAGTSPRALLTQIAASRRDARAPSSYPAG